MLKSQKSTVTMAKSRNYSNSSSYPVAQEAVSILEKLFPNAHKIRVKKYFKKGLRADIVTENRRFVRTVAYSLPILIHHIIENTNAYGS